MGNGCICYNTIFLFEVAFIDREDSFVIYIMIFKNVVYPVRSQLLVCFIGYIFYHVADFFTHFFRNADAKVLLQNVAYTAFSWLAVDTDNIFIVSSSDVLRIDWQIRYGPVISFFRFTPCHTFCDGILMGAGECGKYQISCIWLSFIDMHSGQAFVDFTDLWNVSEIQSRIYTLREHIECQCHDIHVTGTFSISK